MTLQRIILEMSCMVHNDEQVLYRDIPEGTTVEATNMCKRSMFDDPRVVLQRPVFQEEISEGLDTSYKGENRRDKLPELTLILDDYFSLHRFLTFWDEIKKKGFRKIQCSSQYIV